MHVHEYECKKCLHKFLIAHPSNQQDKHRLVKCPVCGSSHIQFASSPLVPPPQPPAQPLPPKQTS